MNHLRTNNARFAGSSSWAGATKILGCSAQCVEYSTNDFVERINGGAVKDDKSPLKDAID